MTPSTMHQTDAEWGRSIGASDNSNISVHLHKLRESFTPSPDKPDETPEAAVRALYLTASGRPVSAARALSTPLPDLNDQGLRALASLIDQRCAGVPLAHITGRQAFMDIEMLAGPQALIPRRETELLAREVVSIARSQTRNGIYTRLIDVCTGSANIALAVASLVPSCEVFASDISPDAIRFAKRNAEHLGLDDKVRFHAGDLFEPFAGQQFFRNVDIVSCNPPYISSHRLPRMAAEIQEHEPRLAFDGGPFGLTIVSRVIREAPSYLKPNGFLCLEVGAGQGPFVARLVRKSGLYRDEQSLISDDTGEIRVLVARAN